MLLDEESRPYVTINTHQGLYQYTRLPFGVSSAPALFQKLMDTVLQGIPGVTCYIDDILVSGKDEAQHLQSLGEVFRRLQEHGFRLKQEKCESAGNVVIGIARGVWGHAPPENFEILVCLKRIF